MSSLSIEKFKKFYISNYIPLKAERYKRGSGISEDLIQSIKAAKSEYWEREMLSSFSMKNLIFGQYRDLINTVSSSSLPKSFSTIKNYYWTIIIDFKSQEKKIVPACFVYFPFDKSHIINIHQTTVGTAASSKKDLALKKSILEIIERHSYYMSLIGKFSTSFIQQKDNIRLYHINNPYHCSIILAVHTQEKIPYISAGICADLDFERAVKHATKEAWLAYWSSCRLRNEILQDENVLYKNIDNPVIRSSFDRGYMENIEYLKNSNYTFKPERSDDDLFYSAILEHFGSIYYKTFEDHPHLVVVRSFIPNAIINFQQFNNLTRTVKPLF